MKKLSGLLLATLIISSLFVFDSCKKGEEDPFISLLSRKARLSGDWTIKSNDLHSDLLQANGSSLITDFVISDQSINITTETKNDPAGDTTITIGASEDGGVVKLATVKFEKDGTFAYRLQYQTIDENEYDLSEVMKSTITITTDVDIEVTGTWNFLSGVEKSYKNKERIAIMYESQNTTTTTTTKTLIEINGLEQPATTESEKEDVFYEYANGERGVVWELVMLKNKEVKMYRTIENNYNYDDGSTGNSIRESGSETLVLKQ